MAYAMQHGIIQSPPVSITPNQLNASICTVAIRTHDQFAAVTSPAKIMNSWVIQVRAGGLHTSRESNERTEYRVQSTQPR